MPRTDRGEPATQAFRIDGSVLRSLRDGLPAVAAQTVAAVMAEVPGYRVGFRGPMGESIQAAVQMAIGGFLKLASGIARTADMLARGINLGPKHRLHDHGSRRCVRDGEPKLLIVSCVVLVGQSICGAPSGSLEPWPRL